MSNAQKTTSMTRKEKMLHRLKILKGHIQSIEKMVEDDTYCISVLHQSLAVQKALKTFDVALMEEHLRTCVVHQVANSEIEKMVDDLVSIYKFK
jgi:DNA-binding FrmR family transcriptional regulator